MTMRPQILLLGFGPTALSALASLLASVRVVGVARAASDEDPVCRLAAAHGVPLTAARSRREVMELVSSQRPDAVVISSYDRILAPAILELCPFINVHYAPLPRLRGNAPVNWAILNGASTTAITIHAVEPGLDSGAILYQESVPIGAEDTATSLFERLNAIQERALGPTVLRALAGHRGRRQEPTHATYGCARRPEDGEIDWRRPAAEIARLTRALTPPFPGAFTHHQGAPLIVHRAEQAASCRRFEGVVPGRVVDAATPGGWIDVLTGDGVLRVHELSAPGQPKQTASTVISSRRARLGLRASDLLQRIDELERRLARLEDGFTARGRAARHG